MAITQNHVQGRLPGGILVFIEPVRRHNYPLLVSMEFFLELTGFTDLRAETDQTFFTREQWLDLLQQAGATLLDCSPAAHSALATSGQCVFIAQFKTDRAALCDTRLRAYLKTRLPAYMIPTQLHVWDALPRNASGKIDRLALAKMLVSHASIEASQAQGDALYDALEHDIAAIWSEVLDTEIVTRDGAAAGDLVLSVNNQYGTMAASSYWYGEASAFWVKGEPHLRRLPTELRHDLAHFPCEVTLLPFLSSDAERLALRHQLRELRWYNVFSGSFLRETLTGLRGWVNSAERLAQAVAQVEQASELDLLGHSPYYRLVFDLIPHRTPRRRAVISTDSSAALTAAVTVNTVNALLRGDIAPGVHFADDVLMATQTFNDVVRLHPGTLIRQYLPDERLEEGKL